VSAASPWEKTIRYRFPRPILSCFPHLNSFALMKITKEMAGVVNIDQRAEAKFRLARSPARSRQFPVTESVALPPDYRGVFMPYLNPGILFSLAEIGIFPCPTCSKPMKLSRIEPGETGFDLRTFDCSECKVEKCTKRPSD